MEEQLNEDFLEELFKSAIEDKNFLRTLVSHVPDNYVPKGAYREVWVEIKRQFKIEQKLPTIGKLKLELRNNTAAKEVLSKMREVVVTNPTGLIKSLEEFILQNKFVSFYNQMGDLYNTDQRAKAYSVFTKGAREFAEFSLRGATFDRVFKGFMERQADRSTGNTHRIKIPTGIDVVDNLIDGGPETGETLLILGDSGVGKSISLVGAGIAAARLGYRVAHFQGEGTRDQCLNRYDSAWLGALYRDVKVGEIDTETLKRARKVIQQVGNGEIYVEAFEQFNTATLCDIRNSLVEMTKLYGHIDRVIIDYLELFDPGDGKKYSASEERFRQTAVARGMKNIAMEFNCDVITATQSTVLDPKSLVNQDFVITRYHLSEDKGKIRPFDNFITINQTPDEKKEQKARIYCDKFREHESGQTLPIAQSLSRTRFFDRKRTLQEFTGVEEDDD